jgi:hypothetical protein
MAILANAILANVRTEAIIPDGEFTVLKRLNAFAKEQHKANKKGKETNMKIAKRFDEATGSKRGMLVKAQRYLALLQGKAGAPSCPCPEFWAQVERNETRLAAIFLPHTLKKTRYTTATNLHTHHYTTTTVPFGGAG